jgi:hypothetical protein
VQTRELLLTVAVIIVPLIIAVVVTLWSLEQVRYRRKAWRAPRVSRETGDGMGSDRAQGDDAEK